MNDMDLFIARTQARLAFFLVIILVVLTVGVGGILLFAVHINSEITGLVVQVVTGVLALCGTAIGYFFARHRPQTKGDEGVDSLPKPTTTETTK
jgi:zinc transporter ZupT